MFSEDYDSDVIPVTPPCKIKNNSNNLVQQNDYEIVKENEKEKKEKENVTPCSKRRLCKTSNFPPNKRLCGIITTTLEEQGIVKDDKSDDLVDTNTHEHNILSDSLLNAFDDPFENPTQEGIDEFLKSNKCDRQFVSALVLKIKVDTNAVYLTCLSNTVFYIKHNLEFTCILRGQWMDTVVSVMDDINIIGIDIRDISSDSVVEVTDDKLLLVVNPNQLISGTSVVSSLGCLRRSVLDTRYGELLSTNKCMFVGSLVHDVFQKLIVLSDLSCVTPELVREFFMQCLESGKLDNDLLAINLSVADIMNEVEEYVKSIVTWIKVHSDPCNSEFSLLSVNDIEENISSPRYGLKGKIDATVTVRQSGLVEEMPLELKTGKMSYSAEHVGQVMEYCMMLGDRRAEEAKNGYLLYIKTGEGRTFKLDDGQRRGLVQLRNTLAHYLSSPVVNNDLAPLPPVLTRDRTCGYCSQLLVCSMLNKAESGMSAIRSLGEQTISHLSSDHIQYFMHWSRLLLMEQSFSQRKELKRRAHLLPIALFILHSEEVQKESFLVTLNVDVDTDIKDISKVFSEGDYVTIHQSTKTFMGLSVGFVKTVLKHSIQILCERSIAKYHSSYSSKVKFIVEKHKSEKSVFISLTYLGLLMQNSTLCARLRSFIIDSQPCQTLNSVSKSQILSIKPILASLNTAQKTFVLKVIMTKDYFILKGFPGTGKTKAIAALVSALTHLNMRVLVAAFTHSAVDNILLQLLRLESARDVTSRTKFLRLGNFSRVHPDIQDYTLDRLKSSCSGVDDLKALLQSSVVIATTALGMMHPCMYHQRFDFVIVDEAGQLLQPVALGPLLKLKDDGKFVLVGDPLQLPPLVQSPAARSLDMDQSLLVRLLANPSAPVASLCQQYRMNQPIMSVANALVYDNQMQCANNQVATATTPAVSAVEKQSLATFLTPPFLACLDHGLDNVLQFLNTDPIDRSIPMTKPLCSNAVECKIVVFLVSMYLTILPVDEIGVITPFRAQVSMLTRELEAACAAVPEVSTVDQFQGRDKTVVIISFVRNKPATNLDSESTAILDDLPRLTVALTRAKCKLILIGHRPSLETYSPIKKLLSYFSQNSMHDLQSADMI